MMYVLLQLSFGFALLCSVQCLSNYDEYEEPGFKCYGGYPVPIGYSPSIVSVQHWSSHICTGIIITTRFVLTSASCVCKNNFFTSISGVSKLRIVASINNTGEIGNIIPIEKVICHPSWNNANEASPTNVAILQVKGFINFTSTQTLASFSISKEVPESELCWFVGFNSTRGVGKHLEYFYIKTYKQKVCDHSVVLWSKNQYSPNYNSTTGCGHPERIIVPHLQDVRRKTQFCNWFGEGSMLACNENFYGIFDKIIIKRNPPVYGFTKLTKIWGFLKKNIPEFNEVAA
ncbi:trypsin 3A1-like [Prorops nasuta]|uniref:trypsin 3A1-like n=1 Tax=Prorops nasuta TaxID=863751 RepID=UPI0034CDBBDA